MPFPPFRDHREPRDWRPWREKPGFFPGKAGCFCCQTTTCTPASASAGTVGSDSGTKCVTCGTQAWIDHFDSLDPGWTNNTASCGAGGGLGSFRWRVTGGYFEDVTGSNIVRRTFTRPSLASFCVEVSAKIVQMTEFGSIHLAIPYGRRMLAIHGSNVGDPPVGNYAVHSKIDSNGCVASGSVLTNFGPVPTAGDTFGFIISNQAGVVNGDGTITCSICYKVNGSVLRVEDGVVCCFADPMALVLTDGMGGAAGLTNRLDDIEVRTN